MKKYELRSATLADAAGMLKVYEYYVRTTAATFEYEPPPLSEFASRIEKILPDFPWLVCLYDGEIIGYAYAGKHRERTAYQWSPESTIYIAGQHHGTGIARVMYETLFDLLRQQGYINVYASVLATNVSSNRFHQAMGFTHIGTFSNVGYKLGAWHSNNWYELPLSAHVSMPQPPKKMKDVKHTPAFGQTLNAANRKLSTLGNKKAAL